MSITEFKRLRRNGQKYSANAVVENGIRFDSKLERDRYLELCQRRQLGLIDYFLMQVPFRLPGGITYRVDFQVFAPGGVHHSNGRPRFVTQLVTYEDCKGMMTPVSQLKIAQVEELYRVKIQLISRENIHD
jgi:hypothetical protein